MKLVGAVSFVLSLLTAFTLAVSPATLPSQTSDGVVYGDAQPIKGFTPPNLPTIGRMLGVPAAEWVGHHKIITRTQSSAEVQKIEQRNRIGFGSEDPRPEFIVADAGRYTGFDVHDGRISAAFIGVPANQKAEDLAKQINTAGQKTPIHVDAAVYQSAVRAKFRGSEYFLATHAVAPAIAASIRSEQLAVGMSEAEADAAMSNYEKEVSSDSGDDKQLNYWSYAASGRDGFGMPTGWYKKTHATCSISAGKVNGISK